MAVLPATAAVGGKKREGGARVVAEEKVGPRRIDLTVASPALGRTAKVRLLRRWPVLYLLHGCCVQRAPPPAGGRSGRRARPAVRAAGFRAQVRPRPLRMCDAEVQHPD